MQNYNKSAQEIKRNKKYALNSKEGRKTGKSEQKPNKTMKTPRGQT